MKTAKFFRYWYLDEDGEGCCTDWMTRDWWQYKHSNHRDDDDMGDEGVVELIYTDYRTFILDDVEGWIRC